MWQFEKRLREKANYGKPQTERIIVEAHTYRTLCLKISQKVLFLQSNFLSVWIFAPKIKIGEKQRNILEMKLFQMKHFSQCLKITEKVGFSITSEASYVYILSGQKLLKMPKIGRFWRFFENMIIVVIQCYQTGHF